MAIKLKCPSCQERIFAEDSDRGKSIRCPGCETRVPVPGGDAPRPPAAPIATAVPVLPVLKPLAARPVNDGIIDAEIVTAAPVKAKPKAAIPTVAPLPEPESRRSDRPKSKTGFRLRGEEDREDDDEDEEDTEPAGQGGSGMLFVILGVGILLLGGIGVGVYFLTRDSDPAVVENTTNEPKGIIPGPAPAGPKPNNGGKPGKNFPDGWDVVTGTDFSFVVPKANVNEFPLEIKAMKGKLWTSKELGTGVECAGAYVDRTPGSRIGNLVEFPRDAFQLKGGVAVGTRQINGRDFTEFKFDADPTSQRVWAHVTEHRVYLFKFSGNQPLSPEAIEKRDQFQANIKVTYPVGIVDPIDLAMGGPGVDPGPGVIPGVGPMPNPFGPKPPPPAAPLEAVVTLPEDGFALELPGGSKLKPQRHTYGIERKTFVGGKHYETRDGDLIYHLYYHDLADEADYDASKFLTPIIPFPWKSLGSVNAMIDGKPGQSWELQHLTFQHKTSCVTVQVGFRIYTLLVTQEGIPQQRGAIDPEVDRRFKKVLDSFKITFDPKKAPNTYSDPTWIPMARTVGFSATAPRGTSDEDYTAGFGFDRPKGKHFHSEDDSVKCHVYIVEMGPKHDPIVTVKDMLGRDKTLEGPTKITNNGLVGEEYVMQGFPFNNRIRVRAYVVGNVAAVVKVEAKNDQPDREVMLKSRTFLDSFRLGNLGGGGGAPVGPVNVDNGDFVLAGKVSPFWSAVALQNTKEILTLGARNPADPSPGGILRRYSYPDFKLKATYHLQLPVNRAVADEKSGRLICSAISKYDPTLDQRELLSWTSDLQIYDLTKLLAGGYGEGDEIKPLSKVTVAQPISGLEVDPIGGIVYASAVILPIPVKGRPPRAPTGKLYKIDTMKGEIIGTPILHPQPIDGLRLAASGKTLVTSEVNVGAQLPGQVFNLLTVDPIAWKKSRLIPIPAPAKDLTFTGEGILALADVDAKTQALAYTEGMAEIANVTSGEIPLEGFTYFRVTPDGKRIVASAGAKQNGLLVMKVTGSGDKVKFDKVSSGATAGGVTVGGHFVLTPDSKYAVLNCGAIVDLQKTTAPPKEKD